MDDKFNPSEKRRSEIDLTSFDLSQFKEYFAQEDAEREAEEKKRAEREAKERAEREAEEKKLMQERIAKKRAREQKEREEFEAKKRAELEAREKEEARRAAEKAAAAAMAAKRAQEARKKANLAASAKLRAQAGADNTVSPDEHSTKTVKPIEFKQFSSILDIDNTASPDFSDNNNSSDDDDLVSFVDEKKTKNIILTVVCAVLCVAFVVCSAAAVYNFFIKGDSDSDEKAVGTANTASVSYEPFKGLETSYKDADYPDSISGEMKAMYSQNSDLVGWLTIGGTAIDYPIMHCKNNTYYLNNHNSFDKSSRYGTPFLDFRCNKFDLSKNTVIYGHRMLNDTHFGSLDNFSDVEYYKSHPIIKYQTLNKSYTFKIYAVFYATTESSVDGGYVFNYYNPNMSSSNFNGYIQMLNQYALYTTDAGLKSDDKIITLSTCSHFYDSLKSGGVDARFVVVGRLLRSGESESVNTNNVLVNSDYRKPQLWYDKKGIANPYASYRSWTPSK